MRRLSRSTPAPQPAAPAVNAAAPVAYAPQQPAAAPAPVQPEVLPPAAPASQPGGPLPTSLATLQPDLLALFDYQPPAVPLPSATDGLRAPRIGFITGKGKYAADIQRALPGRPLATPYLLIGSEGGARYLPLDGVVLVQLAALAYWAIHDDSYTRLAAWLSPQGRNATMQVGSEVKKVQECVLALHLILPGAAALAPDLQPAIVAMTDFRGPSSALCGDLDRAVAATTTREWAQTGTNGALVGLPPKMRVVGAIQAEAKPVKGNASRMYTLAKALVAPAGAAQIQAIAQWGADETCQAELADAIEAFNDEEAAIRALAASTGQAPA